MTEKKRFVDYFDKDHNYIIQDLWNEDEYQVGFANCDEDLFLELVNELNDENDILKQKLKTKYIVNKQYEELQKVKEENEQLKADNNRLVNETAKIIAEHQKRVLDLIDKKIADYNMYYETQIEDQSYNEANAMKVCVIALQELKKELSE